MLTNSESLVIPHAYNPSTQDAEAGGLLQVLNQPRL